MERLLGRMGRIFAQDQSGNGRSLGYVWGFGSCCLTATILLPHPAAARDAGLVAVAIAGFAGATFLFLYAATLPQRALEAITYVGQLLITALTLLWGAPDAPFLWFHVWLVVHSFHFLPPVRATRQIVCAAVLYVAATIVIDAPFPAGTSVVGVGTIVAIGMLVGAFRVRVDELLRDFARSAAIDPLTGLANRRAFSDVYVAERARRARTGEAGALMVLDCDDFKSLNDQRGHAAGDRALCRIAAAMSSIIREIDTAARLGGDEFAVLLSAPAPGAAAAIGDRIRRAVADGNDPDGMTISVGIVELPAGAAVDESAALACADHAMYRAKEQGGNRVSLADLVASPLREGLHALT